MTADQLEFPTATEVCELIIGDPIHQSEHRAVLAAIQADADEHGGEVIPNRVRPRIPAWVYPRVTSATYSALRNRGLLIPTGRWVTNDDAKGRNVGKPQKVYRLTEHVA